MLSNYIILLKKTFSFLYINGIILTSMKSKYLFVSLILVFVLTTFSYAFTFAVIGDRAGRPMSGVFEKNLQEVLKTKPDFIIQLGDILNDSSNSEYEFVKNLLKDVKIPIYFVPGNHDLMGDPKGEKYQKFTGRPLYYYFDYENARFIILNNASGGIGKEQKKWLIEVLESTDRKYKFVFMHQPLISPGFFFLFHKINPIESNELMKIFEEYKVNYVFSGHIHMYYKKVINGTTYIISGIGGSTPYVSPEDTYGKPHFILVDVKENKIEDKMIIVPIN